MRDKIAADHYQCLRLMVDLKLHMVILSLLKYCSYNIKRWPYWRPDEGSSEK